MTCFYSFWTTPSRSPIGFACSRGEKHDLFTLTEHSFRFQGRGQNAATMHLKSFITMERVSLYALMVSESDKFRFPKTRAGKLINFLKRELFFHRW